MGRPDEIAARLQALIGEPHVSESYIRFRLDLLAAQQRAREALASSRAGRSSAGSLPLGPSDVTFPADILMSLFEAIRKAAAAHGRETEDIQRLAAAAAAESGLLPALATAAAFGPDLAAIEAIARRLGILVEALQFVGRALAAVCVAESVAVPSDGNRVAQGSEPHRCPVCGSPPSIARLCRPDGERILTCSLCGHDWRAIRLACACCGTRQSTSLGFLRLDDVSARWVETCEECKGYIKTVDERRLAEGDVVLPVVEESATMHLDLLAEREGYVRRVSYVLSG